MVERGRGHDYERERESRVWCSGWERLRERVRVKTLIVLFYISPWFWIFARTDTIAS